MQTVSDISDVVNELGARAQVAAQKLAALTPDVKQKALEYAADEIEAQQDLILAANEKDLEFGAQKGLSTAMMDRLVLNPERIEGIVQGLRSVASQQDPVGAIIKEWSQPNGLNIQRVRTPIGVIGVIYESRPNVTVDAGALCLKSGNAVILRGGSESFHSATALHAAMQAGLERAGAPLDAIQLMPTRDREAVKCLIQAVDYVDVIVPRGGKGLVGLVQKEARVPVFAHLEGICHVYVDGAADLEVAKKVLLNAKTRRTGICGAAECVLIDTAFSEQHGPVLIDMLTAAGVEVRADDALQTSATKRATADDFGCEFLDMIIAAKSVDGVDGAIAHIREFGSEHTDAILTEDDEVAAAFFAQLNSSILMHNASTQFADGGEFGMGSEIGIATGKMHARGPIGAEQLTSFKYLVKGHGATRP